MDSSKVISFADAKRKRSEAEALKAILATANQQRS